MTHTSIQILALSFVIEVTGKKEGRNGAGESRKLQNFRNKKDKSPKQDNNNNMTSRKIERIMWKRPLPCECCRNRRKKCDLLKPSCTRCARMGFQCEYVVAKRRSAGKEKPALPDASDAGAGFFAVPLLGLRDSRSPSPSQSQSQSPSPSLSPASLVSAASFSRDEEAADDDDLGFDFSAFSPELAAFFALQTQLPNSSEQHLQSDSQLLLQFDQHEQNQGQASLAWPQFCQILGEQFIGATIPAVNLQVPPAPASSFKPAPDFFNTLINQFDAHLVDY
ncbi:hypothetical protein HK100_004861 [Physocladia obscura]|uniref:Zn(2)-C6 fungal-type domain-containing protein n=1 Tax=Physocladia obscura TaxID=109957 RepID=A0AAD5XCA0_9FUNG|nr:hypothetical protein HK100_004861 [Physocladia obscura]